MTPAKTPIPDTREPLIRPCPNKYPLRGKYRCKRYRILLKNK